MSRSIALLGLILALCLVAVAHTPAVAAQGNSATPTPGQNMQQLAQELDAAWQAKDWPKALEIIAQMRSIDPTYENLDEREYAALINHGFELLTANQCTESLSQFRRAHEIDPDGEEALMGLELVSRYCGIPAPDTPTPVPVHTPVDPGPTPTPAPTYLSEPITYVVQPGDTLYSLARRYGTTVQAIMQANGMMNYNLRAGATIWIPASGAPPEGPIVHIVQPGETLYSISRQYNTTVWAIMTANNLAGSTIYAHQALFIPSAMQPGPIAHIVQPGETLFSIAQRHRTTVSLIMMANNLRDYRIYVYQRLVIPPEGWTGWPPLPGGPPSELGPGRTYVVQRGDTLFSIARRFGTTVEAIQRANGLRGTTIHAGNTLRIP